MKGFPPTAVPSRSGNQKEFWSKKRPCRMPSFKVFLFFFVPRLSRPDLSGGSRPRLPQAFHDAVDHVLVPFIPFLVHPGEGAEEAALYQLLLVDGIHEAHFIPFFKKGNGACQPAVRPERL